MNLSKFMWIGFKVGLIMLLGAFIMALPKFLFESVFKLSIIAGLLITIPFVLFSLFVYGYIVWKFRRWLLK